MQLWFQEVLLGDDCLNYLDSVPVCSPRIHFLSDNVFLRADDGVRSLGVQNCVTLEDKPYLHGGGFISLLKFAFVTVLIIQ